MASLVAAKNFQMSERDQQVRWEADLGLIRDNLKLSFEERAVQHERMLDLIDELRQIGQRHREKSSITPQITRS